MEELQAMVSDALLLGMEADILGNCVQVTCTLEDGSSFICQATNSWVYVQWRDWVLAMK